MLRPPRLVLPTTSDDSQTGGTRDAPPVRRRAVVFAVVLGLAGFVPAEPASAARRYADRYRDQY